MTNAQIIQGNVLTRPFLFKEMTLEISRADCFPSGGLADEAHYSVNFFIACDVVNTAIPVFIAPNPSFL